MAYKSGQKSGYGTPRQYEVLRRGAIIGVTGANAVRVIEEGNRTHFFDSRGRRIQINEEVLARVPSTRREAVERIVELRRQLKQPREIPLTKETEEVINSINFFKRTFTDLLGVKKLCEAASLLHRVDYTVQTRHYKFLKKQCASFPELGKAIETLDLYFSVPKNLVQAKRLARGMIVKPLVRQIEVKEGIALYARNDGKLHQFPLTLDALHRILSERMTALSEVEGVLGARMQTSKDAIEKEQAQIREEVGVIRRNAKGKVLNSKQIAEIYKFYLKQKN
ncbi:MAG: hypothetical protein NTY48_06145 [Candidatus Diapherotrites archaeon]|nr:hypothetical protein [Candidatus Diapherotrites archaeon]